MTNLYDFDKHKYLLSSSEWQASVRSVKLSNATLCTRVFLFYIKRHLMSGNEFACSLGSSSAIIAWVWTQKTRWKTLANNVRRYSSRCVRAFRYVFLLFVGGGGGGGSNWMKEFKGVWHDREHGMQDIWSEQWVCVCVCLWDAASRQQGKSGPLGQLRNNNKESSEVWMKALSWNISLLTVHT